MKHIPLKFVKSAPAVRDLPHDEGQEIVLAGYSNVGKSSVINFIANEKDLAKCSKTPGRTQLFNVFETHSKKRVLDLPGYGFAKVPTKLQKQWMVHFSDYLTSRSSLQGLLIITDIRRELRPIDIELIEFCQSNSIPFAVILNKSDKLSRSQVQQSVLKLSATININKQYLFPLSCLKRSGLEPLVSLIQSWLRL